MAPHSPHTLGSAPAPPGPSSTTRSVLGGPDMAPHSPRTLGSATAGLRAIRSREPNMAPTPARRSGAPRHNRGASSTGRFVPGVRGAIIGLGNVAVHGHLPGWLSRPDVEIVAVSDMRPARRAVGAERLPGARWFDSAESLLADARLDFVDICTPPSSHATLIRAALERGVHVLCEKPLVGSPRRPALAVRAAREPDACSTPSTTGITRRS